MCRTCSRRSRGSAPRDARDRLELPRTRQFYGLRVHEATAVDRAVIRFSETGEGQLTWVAPHYRLRAGAFDAVLSIQREERVITVLRIYRSAST